MKKITKRERFEAVKALAVASVSAGIEGVDVDGLVEFCDKEIEALDRKAAKAKETAAKKRAEGDELTERVFAAVGSDPLTIDDIVEILDDEEASKGKVQYRLSQLHRAGRVDKVQVAVGGGENGKARKLVAYCLPGGEIGE